MDIRSLNAATPGPQGIEALAASAASSAAQAEPAPQEPAPALEPAVKLDIGASEGKARYIQDAETDAIVFQVVDPRSGTVIDQLPSENALRNRAYEAGRAAQAAQTASLSRIA